MSEKSFRKSEFKRTIDLGKTDRGQDTDLIRVWRESSGEEKAISLGDINGGLIGDYVPYTGAVDDVDLGEKGISVGYVKYDTTPTSTPTTQGTTYWDVDDNTLAVIMNGTTLKVGEDQYYPVKNQTGVLIPKGTAVRFAGTLGSSGRLLIAPFIADGSVPSTRFMGVTSEDIGDGADGKVMWFGRIRGLNTNAFNEGDILYASTTVAGGFQTTIPEAPNNIVQVCAVINKSTTQGIIFVRPTLGSNINKDEGVKLTSLADKDLLQYQSSTGLFENKSVASIVELGAGLSYDINGRIQLGKTEPSYQLIDLKDFDVSGVSSLIIGYDDSVFYEDFIYADKINDDLQKSLTLTSITGYKVNEAYFANAFNAEYFLNVRNGSSLNSYNLRFFTDGSSSIASFGDSINQKGLEYESDYESNFTARSLVTKQYVDSAISGASHSPVTIGSPANGLSIDASQVLTIGLASTSATGALSSTDWNTFNNKIGGSLTNGRIPFATGANTLGDDSGLTWDNVNKIFSTTGRIQQVNVDTRFSLSRPVQSRIDLKSNPSSLVTGLTDFHGFDVIHETQGSNINTDISLYSFENTTAHVATGNVNKLVSYYSLTENRSTGNVNDIIGVQIWGRNRSTGTITNGYGINILNPLNDGGGQITNYYGIYIPNITSASSNNYSIYSLGKNYLGIIETPSTSLVTNLNANFLNGYGIGASVASTRVIFANASSQFDGDSQFVWNNTAKYLGVGSSPSQKFHVTDVDSIQIRLERSGSGYFELGASSAGLFFWGQDGLEKWRITQAGILQSNGAQTIQTSTGNLTISTLAGNGNIYLTPNGTGQVGIATTSPTNTLDVNGTARIRTISNLGVSATNVLVPDATGVVSLRTATQLLADMGGISGTIASGQVAFGTGVNTVGGDSGLQWNNTTKILTVTDTNGTVRYRGNQIQFLRDGDNYISANAGSSSQLYFETAGALRWRITQVGLLLANGAQSILTSTGNLTIGTNGGNGNILLTPNGTGLVMIGSGTPTNLLDVNGTARIRTISNLGVSATNVLVPDATGVVSLRTATQLLADMGGISGTIASGQVVFGTGVNTVGGDTGLTWDNVNKVLSIATSASTTTRLDVFGGIRNRPLANGSIILGSPDSQNGIVIFANTASTERFDIRRYSNRISFLSSSSSSAPGEPNGIILFNTGNVTLNTATDSGFKFEVAGNARFTTGLAVGSITPTNTLDVNGTARIRTIANLGSSATSVLVPSATGVLSLRTLAELSADMGNAWTSVGSDIYRNSRIRVGSTSAPTERIDIDSDGGWLRLSNGDRAGGLLGGGVIFPYTTANAASRSWSIASDNGTAYGQLVIKRSSTASGDPKLGTDTIIIDNVGSVGINGAPFSFGSFTYLDVYGRSTSQSGVLRLLTSNSSQGWQGYVNSSTFITQTIGSIPWTFGVNSGEQFRIAASGNILFNTTTDLGFKHYFAGTTAFQGQVDFRDNVVTDIAFGTTTGTKIGTATTQKLAFWNATPIVQPSGDILTALSNLGLVATPTLSSINLTEVEQDVATSGTLNNVTLNSDTTIISFSAASTVTGITGGSQGRKIYIRNESASNITLSHESASSTDVNRFFFYATVNFTLPVGAISQWIYLDSRWRVIGEIL